MIHFNEPFSGVVVIQEPEAAQMQIEAAAARDYVYPCYQEALDDFATIHWAWQVAPIIPIEGKEIVLWQTPPKTICQRLI